MSDELLFDPNNPKTRSLLVQLITGRRLDEIPEHIRQRVADRCVETCNQYLSEYLHIHFGDESAAGYHNLVTGNTQRIADKETLVNQMKEAYRNFIELVKKSHYTP